jgi:hypothetical protein
VSSYKKRGAMRGLGGGNVRNVRSAADSEPAGALRTRHIVYKRGYKRGATEAEYITEALRTRHMVYKRVY